MKRIAFYFIGGCCIISSFIGFSQYGIATGIICIVVGVLFISAAHGTSSTASQQESTLPSSAVQQEEIRGLVFNVAGVSFSNESGRIRSRQSILRKIHFEDLPFDSGYEVRLERYIFEDAPAYYVYVNDYIVGNVPKEFIHYLEENSDRKYVVDYFNTYGGGKNKNFGAEMKISFIDT